MNISEIDLLKQLKERKSWGLERCLYCEHDMSHEVTWKTFFQSEARPLLCETCVSKLIRIEGECCSRCNRPFATLDPKFRHEELCYDCVRWERDRDWTGVLSSQKSLFVYNEFLKEVMSRFKFRGDYVLAKLFAQDLRKLIETIPYDLLVPIPLSEERLCERGFNQAEAIISEMGLPPTSVLSRIHTEKQSKKSREARIHLPQVFQLVQSVESKRILLVDDIYTTGSTLMHAAKLVKDDGASLVSAVTIARG